MQSSNNKINRLLGLEKEIYFVSAANDKALISSTFRSESVVEKEILLIKRVLFEL
jgi:hypothetical protein